MAEWTKLVSAKWRELTVTEKEQFQVMAATDKARYTQQVCLIIDRHRWLKKMQRNKINILFQVETELTNNT